ncbi:apoptosis-associated speck-like protein containing a CARD [Leptodactylus fuscus]|uniref:apoptosis-associated speck-like protein containing a CARD n=1 Tax=Leptodactylus fuscus TaxID=238119 RepID=UPI003F4E4C61
MAVSDQDLIFSVLQELDKDSFKMFKAVLRDEQFLGSHDFQPIPRVQLEDKDRIDVTDRLISHYTREGALKVTSIVLKKIKQTELAKRLTECIWNNPPLNVQMNMR